MGRRHFPDSPLRTSRESSESDQKATSYMENNSFRSITPREHLFSYELILFQLGFTLHGKSFCNSYPFQKSEDSVTKTDSFFNSDISVLDRCCNVVCPKSVGFWCQLLFRDESRKNRSLMSMFRMIYPWKISVPQYYPSDFLSVIKISVFFIQPPRHWKGSVLVHWSSRTLLDVTIGGYLLSALPFRLNQFKHDKRRLAASPDWAFNQWRHCRSHQLCSAALFALITRVDGKTKRTPMDDHPALLDRCVDELHWPMLTHLLWPLEWYIPE